MFKIDLIDIISARKINSGTEIRGLIENVDSYRYSEEMKKSYGLIMWSTETICLRFNYGSTTFPRYLLVEDSETALMLKLRFGV